jgi:hypothetical protein
MGTGQGTAKATTVCAEQGTCAAGTAWNVAAVTAATVANPLAITAVNTFVNGDIVTLAGFEGMVQANGKKCTVASVSANGFTCSNLNCAAAGAASAAQPLGALTCAAFTLGGAATATALTDGYNAWTFPIGGQYVEERVFTVGESGATLDWDGHTRKQANIKKRTCKACPQGKRNPHADTLSGSQLGVAQCADTLTCPKNFYITTAGACAACPSNSFRPVAGGAGVCNTVNGVSVCGALTSGGLWSAGGAATAFCKSTCATDEYLSTATVDGAANTIVCKKCAMGKTRTAGDAIVMSGVALPAGGAAPVTGAYGAPDLTQCATVYCPENTHRDGKGTCCACAAGKQRTPWSFAIADGAPDDLDSTAWAASQAATGAAEACHDVICGKDQYNTGKAGGYTCAACPAGQTNPEGDLASADAPGSCSLPACGLIAGIYHRWDHTASACVACKIWETSNEATHTDAGASTTCAPLTCAVNQYVANDDDHTCTACPTGKTAAAGTSRALPSHCDVTYCAANEFVNSQTECSACPVGTTSVAMPRTAAAKAVGVNACTNSGTDDFHPLATCAANFHVVNHLCTACPTGYTNAAGDDPNTSVNTYCDAPSAAALLKHSACAANEHVKDHLCAACPVGTTNAAGDDPHYFDTECTATICSENQHVSCTTVAGPPAVTTCVCAACPAVAGADAGIHLTNPAGDDCSTGVSTQCV